MSEPTRYSEVSNDWNGEAAGLAPSANGEWVKWEDYAALLAVNERVCLRFAKTQIEANDAEKKAAILMEKMEMMNAPMPGLRYQQMKEEIARLKVQLASLLEAGDEMEKHVGREWAPSWVVEDWKAAKKGGAQ